VRRAVEWDGRDDFGAVRRDYALRLVDAAAPRSVRPLRPSTTTAPRSLGRRHALCEHHEPDLFAALDLPPILTSNEDFNFFYVTVV